MSGGPEQGKRTLIPVNTGSGNPISVVICFRSVTTFCERLLIKFQDI